MEIILDNWVFRRYYPEYDWKNKILHLKGKVPIKIIREIQFLRIVYRLDIKDIRVN